MTRSLRAARICRGLQLSGDCRRVCEPSGGWCLSTPPREPRQRGVVGALALGFEAPSGWVQRDGRRRGRRSVAARRQASLLDGREEPRDRDPSGSRGSSLPAKNPCRGRTDGVTEIGRANVKPNCVSALGTDEKASRAWTDLPFRSGAKFHDDHAVVVHRFRDVPDSPGLSAPHERVSDVGDAFGHRILPIATREADGDRFRGHRPSLSARPGAMSGGHGGRKSSRCDSRVAELVPFETFRAEPHQPRALATRAPARASQRSASAATQRPYAVRLSAIASGEVVSDGGQNLESQRLVSQPEGCRRRARGSTGRLFFKRLNEGTGSLVSRDSPLPPARTYPSSDGKLAARGSILDVAVREPQKEDRRCRDTDSVLVVDLGHLVTATRAARSFASPSPPSRRTTGSTWTVRTAPSVSRLTDQRDPRRVSVSPAEGSSRRVRSYSKSPSGNRITNARAGTMHLPVGARVPCPSLRGRKPTRRRFTAPGTHSEYPTERGSTERSYSRAVCRLLGRGSQSCLGAAQIGPELDGGAALCGRPSRVARQAPPHTAS